jgi:hypothetical protein
VVKGGSFSIRQALASGLRLPVRNPRAVLLWIILLSLPNLISLLVLLPLLSGLSLPEAFEAQAADRFSRDLIGFQLLANGFNLMGAGAGLLVIVAAVRATLRIGRSDRWGFIRIGMDELRVAVVMVAIVLGLYAALFVLALIGVALGFALYGLGQTVFIAGLSVFGLLVTLWFLLGWSRLSILAPLSVILGSFAFVEGWQLGRGQTLRLAALNLMVWLIYSLVLALVGLLVVVLLISGFFATGVRLPSDPLRLGDVFAAFRPMSAWIGVSLLPLVLFTGWSTAFVTGALTSAARQLADGPPADIDRPG